MKIFNIIFCVLFIVAAALQWNDPDPYVWIPIYLYGAVLCFFAIKKKFYPVAYFIGISIYAAYALYLFFTPDGVLDWLNEHQGENIWQGMKTTKPWIEVTREFFGLVILILVLSVNYMNLKKKRSR